MKNVILMKKEGYLGLTYTWGRKPLKIWWRKRQKFLDWIDRGEKARKRLKKLFEIVKNTWEEAFLKTLIDRNSIGGKLASIDRKIDSIDPASIKHRSSQENCNQNFYRIFDWSSNGFDRSKIWKTQIFEK